MNNLCKSKLPNLRYRLHRGVAMRINGHIHYNQQEGSLQVEHHRNGLSVSGTVRGALSIKENIQVFRVRTGKDLLMS